MLTAWARLDAPPYAASVVDAIARRWESGRGASCGQHRYLPQVFRIQNAACRLVVQEVITLEHPLRAPVRTSRSRFDIRKNS